MTKPKNNFKFGTRSNNNLNTVHQDLHKVMVNALSLSDFDFGITEGRRTIQRQRELVATGKSKTLNSMHLSGLAVDIAVYDEKGHISWDYIYFTEVAKVVRISSIEYNVPIIWGGCWKKLSDIQEEDMDRAIDDYIKERQLQRRNAFVDAPHFELDKIIYRA